MSTPLCECSTALLSDLQTSVQCFLAAALASVRLCAALPIRLQSRLQSSITPPPPPLPQPVSASFSLCTDMRICVIWTVGCINLFLPRLPQRDSDPSSLPPFSSPPLPSPPCLFLCLKNSTNFDKFGEKKRQFGVSTAAETLDPCGAVSLTPPSNPPQ